MENNNLSNEEKALWKKAKRRAMFKKQLYTYLVINVFLWLLWAFGSSGATPMGFPWPAFVSLGWGIGLAFSFYSAYVSSGDDMTEKEYQKLKNKQ